MKVVNIVWKKQLDKSSFLRTFASVSLLIQRVIFIPPFRVRPFT